MCATCTLFVAPRSCKVVEGESARTAGANPMRWRIRGLSKISLLRDEHAKPNGPIVITVRHPEWALSLRLSADISGT
jgi:hypothetical protein